jgi:hypothetical protein
MADVLSELDAEQSGHHPWIYIDEGTIEMSRGKTRCNSPFLAQQLSVFFALARYRVVNIVRSCSDMVLQTIKHTMIYPSSGPSLEVIALRLVV